MDSESVQRSTNQPARPGFPDLPNEIIVPILKQLSPDQLLGLAFLSRRLHLLALPMYFQHIGAIADGANPSACDINVCPWAFSTVLPLLRKSFFIESITNLTCSFPNSHSGYLHEVLSLTRFVSRMVSVDAVILNFGWEVSPSPVSVDARTTASAALLQLLAQKSCTSISVKYIGNYAEARQDKSPFIQRFLDPLRGKETPTERASQPSGLHVNLPLSALSHSWITHLSLDNLNLSSEDWTAILRNTTLPYLTYLSIIPTYANAAFLRFLLRHPSLTAVNIQLHDNRPSLPWGLLPKLTTIAGDIGTLEYFSHAELARLETVNASVTIHFLKFRTDFRDSGPILEYFRCKRGCDLRLVIRIDFNGWYGFDNVYDHGVMDERWQPFVKTVLINTNAGDDKLRARHKREIIPRWLGEEFPNVEEVQIGHEQCYMNPGDRAAFNKAMRNACRFLKTVSVNGESLP